MLIPADFRQRKDQSYWLLRKQHFRRSLACQNLVISILNAWFTSKIYLLNPFINVEKIYTWRKSLYLQTILDLMLLKSNGSISFKPIYKCGEDLYVAQKPLPSNDT